MLVLSLVWLTGGAIVGGLAWLAALRPVDRGVAGRWSPWASLAVGALGAVMGGWLGTALLGRFFGSPTAAWVAVTLVVASPWVVARLTWGGDRALNAARDMRGSEGARLEQPS